MRTINQLFLFLVVLVSSTSAMASKERMLEIATFSMQSVAMEKGEPISLSGTQSAKGIQELRIKAFGRDIVMPSSVIAQLQGFLFSGIQLSYEHGFKEGGGPTIYVSFSMGSERTKTIAVNAAGTIRLHDR